MPAASRGPSATATPEIVILRRCHGYIDVMMQSSCKVCIIAHCNTTIILVFVLGAMMLSHSMMFITLIDGT